MKFKVGPAKTRGGSDAVIYAIHENSISPIHGAIKDEGVFGVMSWAASGIWYLNNTEGRNDILPNAEPYVFEFVCEWKRGTSGFIYPYECDLVVLESLQGKRTRVRVEVLE